ncbi:MAG: TetR/AcrR family transcriptional regulator [Firmicutes bacterium]|nr:TetR/AcrR family transcriptional regulator [Candidatus Colimorpha enterica]
MANDTKGRILDAALVIFSRNGYAGTNLKDIAESVGVVKSAFYRHFSSKEEVWNAVIDRMENYYSERFGSTDHLPGIPSSWDEFYVLAMKMINFTIHDERIIMTRRLLLTEQFRDGRINALATKHFLNGMKDIYRIIFAKMAEKGLLIDDDPEMLAFAFTTPVSALIHYCDREPEKESEIMCQIEDFVKHFIKIYGKK